MLWPFVRRAPKTAPTEPRHDGWVSTLTGLGQARDKRTSVVPFAERLTYQDAQELYRGNDLAARAIERLPDDALRRGWRLSVRGDAQVGELVAARCDELGVSARLKEAWCWARAYGGAGILLGVDDGRDPALPVDKANVRDLKWLTVLDRQELVPASYYEDPRAPKFGEPETYRVQATGASAAEVGRLVHESRVIRFDGVKVSRQQARETQGWGDSVLVRMHETLRDFGIGWGSAAALLTDFAQAVFAMEGLHDAMAAGRDDLVIRRMQLLDMSRSTIRGVLLDSKETFRREPTPLSGLPELLDRLSNRLAAAASMPVTLLMGQSPAGLSATGDSDIRWWYDGVASAQTNDLRPRINALVELLLRAKDGPTGGVEPETWTVEFNALWELTDTEKATLRKTVAEADAIYIQSGVVAPEEVAVARFGGDTWSMEMHIDLEDRELLAQPDEPGDDTPEVDEPESDEPGGGHERAR